MIYLSVECANCDAIHRTPTGTRQEVWHQAKELGWKLGMRGDHYCPECWALKTAAADAGGQKP